MQETLEKIKNSRSAGEVFLAALVRELYRLAADAGLERRIGARVVLDQPEAAAQVFRDPDTYLKDYGVIAALGDSRFNTDGADWERRRGLTQPVYNAAARGRDWISAIYADEVSRADANMESVCTALTRAAVRAFLTALGIDAPITPFVPFVGELRNLAAELQHASMTEVGARPDRGTAGGGVGGKAPASGAASARAQARSRHGAMPKFSCTCWQASTRQLPACFGR